MTGFTGRHELTYSDLIADYIVLWVVDDGKFVHYSGCPSYFLFGLDAHRLHIFY
jgi:hypothetical protein